MGDLRLRMTSIEDLRQTLDLIEMFHQEEDLTYVEETTRIGVCALLGTSSFGRIWLVTLDNKTIGYVAICFSYSIEYIGRDAILGEFYIQPEYRGNGIGLKILSIVKAELEILGFKALHAEVNKFNDSARSVYELSGFNLREHYHHMSAQLGK